MKRALVGLGLVMASCGDSSHHVPRCVAFGEDCRSRTLQEHITVIEEGQNGQDGLDGIDGLPGLDGKDGSSCSVEQTSTGAAISCTDGSYAEILHGTDGLDGQDGTDGQDAPVNPFQITEVIDPCGKQTTYDEVILRMANGQLVAYFASHGGFLAILGPGNYITTDGTGCLFKVHPDLTITW